MKKSELRQLIKEEISKVLKENINDYSSQKNRVKEWLIFAFDGKPIDSEIDKKINILLNNNNKMTRKLFQDIWQIYTKKYSTGDSGADWDAFQVIYDWVIDGDESHFDFY
jgi:polyhydroxyalkanoate synthesis regulator protein